MPTIDFSTGLWVDTDDDTIADAAAGSVSVVIDESGGYYIAYSDSQQTANSTMGDAGGIDAVIGTLGDDTMTVTGIDDVLLSGGGGDDEFVLGIMGGSGTIDGGSDNDTAISSGDLFEYAFTSVEVLDLATSVLVVGTIGQFESFETIILSNDLDAQIQFYLVGAGDSLDFSTRVIGDYSVKVVDFGVTSGYQVIGSANGDELNGSDYNDTLNGGGGGDSLAGGVGDDTYVTDGGDTITENADQGTDTVRSSVVYTLGANLENLTLIGSAAINGAGNGLDNRLDGSENSAVNTLYGLDGDDTYILGAGDKVVEGADAGWDSVYTAFAHTLAANVENLFLTGSSAINGAGNALDNFLDGSTNSAANTLYGLAGNDSYDVGYGDIIVEAVNGGYDVVQSAVAYTLAANVEELYLYGATAINGAGNALGNTLYGTGNSAANILYGLGGDDEYFLGAGDNIVEGVNAGNDRVYTEFAYTLAANVENLRLTGSSAVNGAGNALNNFIESWSNSAANTLYGLGGDDYYVLGVGDQVVEGVNSGTDSVQTTFAYTLGANVENLYLSGASAINGAGNTLNNTLDGIGNSAANTLYGLAGNDRYHLGVGDTAVEGANAGTDTIYVTFSYTLGANFENLELGGSAAINGAGNAADNVLDGRLNSAANSLYGLGGNDTYVLGAGDTAVEGVNAGTDTVQSYVSQTLGANIENLTLLGSASDGTGNALNNIIVGGSGSQTLNGLGGNDTLTTGDSFDTIVFSTALNAATNVDTITDFDRNYDTIYLDDAIFSQLPTGLLSSDYFRYGSAIDANDHILYNSSTGAVSYDADGNGVGSAIQFAILVTTTGPTSFDFFVV